MSDVAAWLGVGVGLAAFFVAYVTYRSQRGRVRIEYLLEARTKILPTGVPVDVRLTDSGVPVPDAAITVIRVINTGDKAIAPDQIESELRFMLAGASRVMLASITFARPADFLPILSVEADVIRIERRLINPGDMLVVQALTSGLPETVELSGRIAFG